MGTGSSETPSDVADATRGAEQGDIADQADRLSVVMEAEAVRNALAGASGEGSLEGYDLPLEDDETLVAEEGAVDASDDPMHAGGLTGALVVEAEVAAMHVVDDVDPAETSTSMTRTTNSVPTRTSTSSTNRSHTSPPRIKLCSGSIRPSSHASRHVIGSTHVREDHGGAPRRHSNHHPQSP